MLNRISLILVISLGGAALTGCAPLIGAAGAVIVDEGMEQKNGGDGLF